MRATERLWRASRATVCEEEEDWEVIEKRLGCGEEVIDESRDELTCVTKMYEWGPRVVPDDLLPHEWLMRLFED